MRRLAVRFSRIALSAQLAVIAPEIAEAQDVSSQPGAPVPAERVVTLAEVEASAMARQPQVLVARAATRVAEAQAEQARSPLLPQVSATASYTLQTGNFAPRPGAIPSTTVAVPTPSLTRVFDYWNFGVTGTQLLYDFGQTSERYHAASSSVDAQRLAERTTRVQILSTVRRAYFSARAMKELVLVAHDTLEDQNRHLVQVQGFVQVGTQPPIALAQQRASVDNAKVQLIVALNNYETAKAQLNQAAGIPSGTDYSVGDDDLAPLEDEDQPLETLVSKAFSARPELGTLEKQREAQVETLRSARGGYGPTLSAVVGASAAGTPLAFDVHDIVPNWSAELLLSWLLFQGGLTTGQVHQAEAGLQSVDAQRSFEELQVRLDVDSARLAVRAAKETITAAHGAAASAQEQLRLAEQRYSTGVGSIIELTDAQVSYTSAAAQVVQARYGLASARAQLLAALGRT
jgi:outer membrane protein